MKSMFKKGNLVVFLLFVSLTTFGQSNYEIVSEKEGVKIYKKWKFSNKDKPAELHLIVKNTNGYTVEGEFTVSFFDTGIAQEESEPLKFCLKPNQKARVGKLSSVEMTNEKVKSDVFTFEINQPIISKVETCTK